MAQKRPQILVIADYGKGDPAFEEVYLHVSNLNPTAEVRDVSVEGFSTVHTGFWVYQLALQHEKVKKALEEEGEKPRDVYFYVNTAPRKDDLSPRRDNAGEGLVYARLTTGLQIVGVLSGNTFSLVKPLIEELRAIDCASYGSQFRSRDVFPRELRLIVNGDYSHLGDKVSLDTIPEPKRNQILHVDGYGNIKLSTRIGDAADFKPGERVDVTFATKTIQAVYTDGIFSVPEGAISLAPGSSGPHGNSFLEISKRGGSAWMELLCPGVESVLKLERVERHSVVRMK